MDGWQAAQNWIGFTALAGAIGLYYYHTRKQLPTRPPAASSQQQQQQQQSGLISATASKPANAKSRPRKQKVSEKKDAESDASGMQPKQQADNGVGKGQAQAASVTDARASSSKDDHADKDFVKMMLQARQGVDVKMSEKQKGDRPRTVKPKRSGQVLSSGSSQIEGDDGEWSPVVASQPKVSGVEDMLEAPTTGPQSLRITAPLVPAKPSPARQPKKEIVETKKQRQNRQRVEQQKGQREEDERQRRALEERQRRAAREARGEPAKNGTVVPPAPASNPWSGSTSAQPSKLVESAPPSTMPLLDTFDAESTSSSNDAHVSTAATSTTDGVPAQWSDEPTDDRVNEALAESSPWEEAPSKKRGRASKHAPQGRPISAGGPLIVNGSNTTTKSKSALENKANGFSALHDEAD